MSYHSSDTFFHIERFSSDECLQILRLDRSVRCIERIALLEVRGIYYILYQEVNTLSNAKISDTIGR